MTTMRRSLVLAVAVVLVAAVASPSVVLASSPPESATMAEAVVATRTEATRLMEVFAAAGPRPTSAEMHIAACEDLARMHRPNALVWFENPYGRPVERSDVDAVVELLAGDGWSLTESPRFDDGVDDNNPIGYTVSARRGEHRIIFRVLTDGRRGWFDLLGACLDNTDHERELYQAIGRWALPVPSAQDTVTSASEDTAVP
jgi:hypothetical protein